MKTLKLLFIIFVFLLVSDLKSQDWMNWDSLGNDINFYKIQAKFNDYWGPKNIGHNTPKNEMGGWKAYKRWEWFWEQRVAPSGQFPPAGQLMQESIKWKARKENSKEKKQEINNWTNLGPFTSTGGYAGLGRINWVQEDPNYNGTTNKILWIGSPGGGLWKTNDDGANWESKFEGFGSMGISSIVIDPDDTNIMYIATGDGEVNDTYSIGVLKSTNGGDSWNTTGLNWSTTNNRTIRKIVMDPYDNDILYAATSNGIYKTINAGSTWTQVRSSTRYYDIEFKPGSSDTLYASGSTEVVRTTNAGTNWTVLGGGLPTTGINRIELAVSPNNTNYVYALFGFSGSGNNNGFHSVYRSTDGGTNWTARATYSGGAPNLLGWDTDGGDTGGQAWYDLVLACSPTDADLLFVGGVNCWKSTNGGTDWTLSSHWYGGGGVTAVHADHHFMGFAKTTSRLYNGNDGGIYRSSNNGTNWSWLGSGLPITQLYRLGSSKTNAARIICGAQDNGTKLIKSSNWSDVMGGDGMECIIDHSNADVMYGTVYYGALSKSVNAGSSFSQISISSSEQGGWVAPYVMHPTNSDIIFMGYKNIFKTTNAGSSWAAITSGWTTNLTVLHVAPSNPDYIYAGTGSSLKYSSNGGSTWTTITLPISQTNTYLAINEYNPVKLYATFSGYSSGNKVFYSEDAGANWTNISGNLPNVPANTIVYQRSLDNRLYVGTDIGVFWIDDNETEWQDFNEGLPDTKITELEIHYGTGKIRAATYGRGVWESEITPSNEVDTPILAYPADNSTNFEFDTKLGWYKSNNATSYGVQISINSDMSNPLLSMTGIVDTTFVIKDTLLAYNTKYYFRVNAKKDTIISDWSAIRNFKTQEFVLIPTQIQPTNNSSGIAMNTKIFWKKSSTSQSYGLQVSTNSNMSNPIINVSGLTDSTWTISDTLFNYSTNYYWQVNAKRDTATSNWSGIWNFKVKANLAAPTLTFPSNNATGIKFTDTLKWSAVSGANNYNILLSTDQNFSEILTNQTSSNNQLYLGSFNLKLNTNYYWKVLSKINDEIGEWSSVFKFTTRTISHNYCIPVTSICDEYIGQVIFNAISKTTDCDSYSDYSDYITGVTKGNTYSIKVTNPLPYTGDYVGVWFDWNQDNDFVDTGEFTQLTTSNYSVFNGNITIPTTALKGKTMMRVRLLYGETLTPCGNATYGEVEDYSVYLIAAVLATPTLTSPTNNSSNQNLALNLTWGTVSGATSYTVQVSTVSDFSSFIVNTSQSGNSYNLQNLNYISRYYWRVIANNTDTMSNWSTVFNFKTLAKPVDLLSPVNNAVNQTKNLQLKWYNNSGITKYQLQVSKFNDFTTNYLSTFTTDTTLNSSFYNSTLYYWRSRAIYNTDTSAWSSIRNFTVKDSLSVPVLATPTNNATNQKTKVLLNWNNVNFAEKYKLQISTSNTFTTTVYDNWVSISEFNTTSLNLNYNTIYYWRVLAVDFADTTAYSSSWQFTTNQRPTAPSLVSVHNNDEYVSLTPKLIWSEIPMADGYRLQVARDINFNSITIDATDLNDLFYNIDAGRLIQLTNYYWRTSVIVDGDTSNWSSVWKFKTGIASGINKYSVSLSGEKSDNCNVVWTENNIDISSINTTNDDCGGAGNCNFVNSNDKLTLNNSRIKFNLVDLNPFVDSIKVFVKNSCGSNCTKAYLYSNGDKIDEASSQSNGIITLTLRNNFSYITDLYVSSCNAEVLELTIYTNGNYPEDVPTDWDYAENTGSHSIITVPTNVENIINSRKLAIGDAIGVFYTKDADLKCAGYSIFNGMELNITVWGDDPLTAEKDGFNINEDYKFKLWDSQESKEIMARVKYSSGNPYFESDGHSVLSQIYGTDVMQSITINQGWNLNSSYIIPTNANISQVFDDIKVDIVIVKNSTGKVYIPATNTNTIGNWNYKEGYQIYASKAAVLKVNGIEAVPQNVPIYLNKGWSFIPYLRKFDANINSSLQTIEEYNNLVIVKNNSGQIYMPGGSNTIGKMKIGQAYQTYLKEKDTLIYAPNYVDRSSNDNSVEDYTAINLQTNIKPTGNSMIIQLYIPNSQSGDEIGAWNEKGILIGSSLIIDKKALITLWGSDEFTNQIATAKVNEKLTLKLLPNGSKELFNISTSAIRGLINQNSNSLIYIKDEVLILNAEINGLIRDVSLLNIYPNPTKDLLNVDIELNEKSYCDLGIFDLMGREIISIVKDNMNAGVYRFKINLHNYTNGTYNIRMNCNNTIINKQFVIVK